jgi:hypothetical protein
MPREFVVPSVTVHADARTTRMRRSEGEFLVVRGTQRTIVCYCESVSINVKEPDCTGHRLKDWCIRALQYTRNGNTGTLSSRLAFGDFSHSWTPQCELNLDATIEWFYEPTEEEVSSWLATMVNPPPSSGSYKITLFFNCQRGMVWRTDPAGKEDPCDLDEASSKVELQAICYGSGELL